MNILVLFTGGTIACSRSDGALSPDTDNSYALLQRFDSADVRFTTASPYFVLSENLGTAHLRRLYDCLTGYDLSCFDGVIIAHGTDTLAYTAAYLSLRLGLCDTPVVLVSAAYPLSDSRTNGFVNLNGALDFIRAGKGKGVFVSYQNDGENLKIHRGCLILPHLPYDDSIRSVFDMYYAEIVDGNVLRNPDFREPDLNVYPDRGEDKSVLWLRAHPSMTLPPLDDIDAVLFEGYHSGTLPTDDADFIAFCMQAREKNIPLYLTGAREGFDYASKQAFDKLGIRTMPPVSPACCYFILKA